MNESEIPKNDCIWENVSTTAPEIYIDKIPMKDFQGKNYTKSLNRKFKRTKKEEKKKITASKLQLSIVSTMTVFPLCICRRENRMHIYKSGMPTCHSSVPNPLLLKISALQRKQQRPRINNWSYWTSSITQIKKNGSYLPIMDQQCDY